MRCSVRPRLWTLVDNNPTIIPKAMLPPPEMPPSNPIAAATGPRSSGGGEEWRSIALPHKRRVLFVVVESMKDYTVLNSGRVIGGGILLDCNREEGGGERERLAC